MQICSARPGAGGLGPGAVGKHVLRDESTPPMPAVSVCAKLTEQSQMMMTGDGRVCAAAVCGAEMGRVEGWQQQTGKRGWEDGVTCAKRARIQHFGVPADACFEDSPSHAPETGIITHAQHYPLVQAPPSVYEQYLQKEREWGSTAAAQAGLNRQGHGSAFECPSACPSGWSGTEWDCCPVPFVAQQQHATMDCDGGAEAQYLSLDGDMYPRGC